jgi:2-polyprenyl-3-methyl-5-hydroxy-6-metoxy-1,4-benzoquinol methylase
MRSRMMDKRQLTFNGFEVPDTPRINKVANFVRKYFKSVRGLYLLECGLAKGGLADLLSKEGAICFGIDINPRHIPGVTFIRADLNGDLPKFTQSFDVIFAGELIEHLFDDIKFIKECYHALRSNGIFIVTVPNLLFGPNRIRMLFGKTPLFTYRPYHYHIYTKKEIKSIIEQAGFEILKISSSHILFSTRRNKFGRIFEILGDVFPSLGAHLIVFAKKI